MIVRFLAFLLLIWMLGFAWFTIALPQPLGPTRTDAVVVMTGGPGRINRGLETLNRNWSRELLISGVDREVKPAELAAEYRQPESLFACCISLGFEAVDTRSNALETARWLAKHKSKSVRVITTDWHMRRAEYELARVTPPDVTIYADAVASNPSWSMLFLEYHKYILRVGAGLLGI